MSRGRSWSEEEDALLRELYPVHDIGWQGWPLALPGRTAAGAFARAHKLGLRKDPSVVAAARARAALAAALARTAGDEGLSSAVARMLMGGMPPSAIDARLGLEPGTARKAVTARWQREKEGTGT